jgi:hypothetical protein
MSSLGSNSNLLMEVVDQKVEFARTIVSLLRWLLTPLARGEDQVASATRAVGDGR